MIRKTFYITPGQLEFLKGLKTISVSEHIRRAVEEYIDKRITKIVSNATQSLSKKGGENGR